MARLWTIRDGKVVRSAWFRTREEAVGAAGLSESTMSENVEIVRSTYERFNAGDVDEWLTRLHPDVEIKGGGVFPGLDTDYRGHAGARRLRAAVIDAWASFRAELRELVDRGDYVGAVVDLRGTGRESGVGVSLTFHHAFRLDGGLIVCWALFPTLEEAFEAVGLSA